MQSRNRKMTDRELSGIVDRLVDDSLVYEDSELAKIRRKALAYYEGDETLGGDVPPPVNRSTVVSRDVSDTHGWIVAQMLRIFLASDRVVIYEARKQESEEKASEATDGINYKFLNECNGYVVIRDAIWDGCLLGNGVFKHWWDDTPEYRTETKLNLTEQQYLDTITDPNVEEIIEHTEKDDPEFAARPQLEYSGGQMPDDETLAQFPGYGDGIMPAGGMMPDSSGMMPAGGMMQDPALAEIFSFGPPKLHDLKIKKLISNGRLRVVNVSNDEFRVDPNATMLDEDHVRFCAHVITDKTRSYWMEQFKDPAVKKIIDELPAYVPGDRPERNKNQYLMDYEAADRSTDLLEIWECYLQIDFDGDGTAEWRSIFTAKGKNDRHILVNEEWDYGVPFSEIVPDPIPHQRRGRSLYEQLGDVQRVKTVYMRGINDNLYWINNPQRTALKGGVDPSSMDALVNPKFGETVWTTVANAITDLPVPFIADKLLAGMDLADRVREFRTGVSPATMSLDPEALVNQTATAVNAAQTASQTLNEMRARNIADGLRRLFACILKLVIKNQKDPFSVKIGGKWKTMQPDTWDADMDVIINVGLGSGSRDRDMVMLQAVAGMQKEFIAGYTPMIAARLGMGPDKVLETGRNIVEASGLRSPEKYFPVISEDQVNQLVQELGSQPDPKAAEAQAKIAAQQAEMQAKMQLQQAEAAGQMQLEQARIVADQQARQKQAEFDWQNKQTQSQIDNEHRALELQSKANAAIEEIRLKHEAAEATARREFEYRLQELEAKTALKMRELELEAALKRETIEMQENVSPNIEEAE